MYKSIELPKQPSGFTRAGHTANVDFYQVEHHPLPGRGQSLHYSRATVVAIGKVVHAHHIMVQLEQCFQLVAAYVAGQSGHKPGCGLLAQLGVNMFVAGLGVGYRRPSALPMGRMDLTSNTTALGWPKALIPEAPSSINCW
jgi:hypothetical protein